MDENTPTQEAITGQEVPRPEDRTPEAPQTEDEKNKEAKAQEEARKQRLNQAELDIHTLYNYAVQSPNFMNNSKHCLGSYIRLIALIELLGGQLLPTEEEPKDRAAKRRDQKELEKGRENVDMAREVLKK